MLGSSALRGEIFPNINVAPGDCDTDNYGRIRGVFIPGRHSGVLFDADCGLVELLVGEVEHFSIEAVVEVQERVIFGACNKGCWAGKLKNISFVDGINELFDGVVVIVFDDFFHGIEYS